MGTSDWYTHPSFASDLGKHVHNKSFACPSIKPGCSDYIVSHDEPFLLEVPFKTDVELGTFEKLITELNNFCNYLFQNMGTY